MQSIPLAVLKLRLIYSFASAFWHCMQSIPLAVLKPSHPQRCHYSFLNCMQSIPLAVWKRQVSCAVRASGPLHAIHTACGIETHRTPTSRRDWQGLHAIHTACGIETHPLSSVRPESHYCMQSIPLAVLKLI